MPTHLILSGGVGHPFADTSAALVEVVAPVLDPLGVTSSVVEPEAWETALADVSDVALLTVNALRWRMLAPRYEALRADHAYLTSPTLRAAVDELLARGCGLLSLHTGCICFDDWPQWGAILGATWDWDHSFHPLHGDQVALKDAVTGRRSVVSDELYHDLAVLAEREVLATATLPAGLIPINPPPLGPGLTGDEQVVMWRRRHGDGRVVVDTLGHDHHSLDDPTHADALRAAVAWAVGQPRSADQATSVG